MLWPGLPRLYQLCVLTLFSTPVVRHPLSAEDTTVSLLMRAWRYRADTSWRLKQRTPVPCVVMQCLLVSTSATLEARNENSSALLSSMQRNSCQFPATALDGSTRLLSPFPFLLRVSACLQAVCHVQIPDNI